MRSELHRAAFAFTRMVGSIPTNTPEAAERMKINMPPRSRQDRPVRRWLHQLRTDKAKHVTGLQIFGVRNDEILPILAAASDPGNRPQLLDEAGPWKSCLERAILDVPAVVFPLDLSRVMWSPTGEPV
ncbi:hypothetical protein ACU4GD_20595 [Cupriavidus basilensis]